MVGSSRPAILIFDVDGTLVDVSRSYREAAPAAARLYLRLLGVCPPPLDGSVYDHFKRMTGFNDDWDLTAGLLEVLVASLPPVPRLPDQPPADQDTLLAVLRTIAAPLVGLTPHVPEWQHLVPAVRAAGGGLTGLRRITGGRNAHLVWRTGDAATTDLVQRLFSEIYLGESLFAEAYGFPARFSRAPGLIEREEMLISPAVLDELSQHARLGIATGRARFEMAPLLARYDLGKYFTAVTTTSDALEAQTDGGETLLKPHPYLLLRAADALDPTGQLAAAYVGDAPDDIVAARRADAIGPRPWLAVGLANAPALAEDFLALGAERVLAHPDELVALFGR